MDRFEVGIIGGGVHGASAAFHLGTRGISAVLFERGAAASGPTGRSGAICRAYYTNPFLAQVARASLDMLASFEEHTGGRDAGFRATGALFLHAPQDRPEVERAAEQLNALGTATDLLDLDALRQRVPDFDLSGVGLGAWEHGAGYADPAATTSALLERARELGVDVRLFTPVTTIGRDPAGAALMITVAGGEQTTVERLRALLAPFGGELRAFDRLLRHQSHEIRERRLRRIQDLGQAFRARPARLALLGDPFARVEGGRIQPGPPCETGCREPVMCGQAVNSPPDVGMREHRNRLQLAATTAGNRRNSIIPISLSVTRNMVFFLDSMLPTPPYICSQS
jgi:hypothetical protein